MSLPQTCLVLPSQGPINFVMIQVKIFRILPLFALAVSVACAELSLQDLGWKISRQIHSFSGVIQK